MTRTYRLMVIVALLFAAAGAVFSGVSTSDFIAHLDRQVHSVTCTYIPGSGETDSPGTGGCYTVLMSPYSSVFRTSTWGGLPIALASLAVFLFLIFKSLDAAIKKEEQIRSEALFLFLASLLPLTTSIVYLYISLTKIGTVCKLCVGIYASSFGFFLFSLIALILALKASPEWKINWGKYALYVFEGILFVFLGAFLFYQMKPAYTEEMTKCGELTKPEDKNGVRINLQRVSGGVPALEILDPLCPACKGFNSRLAASGLKETLDLDVVLFPLDKECNWMIEKSMHPGACAVSRAILCAPEQAKEIIGWAFENQAQLVKAAEKDSGPVYQMVTAKFPQVSECIQKPATKTKLNNSLRWIADNALSVLAPQLFIRNRKLCDEDTDLGLEYSLQRLLNAGGTSVPASSPAPAASPTSPSAPAQKGGSK